MSNARVDFLVVDDSPQDVELVVAALEARLPGVITVSAANGAEALETLEALPPDKVPRVILVDIKMPKVDGFGMLRRVKSSSKTSSIPVVILTSSAMDRGVRLAYALGANSYVVKSTNFEEFTETVGRMGEYWLNVDLGPPPKVGGTAVD